MNTAKRIRFSVADFVIILMIVACVIGIAMRYDIAEKFFSKTKTIDTEVTFSVTSATENTLGAFTAEAEFMYGDKVFGKLTEFESDTSVQYYENSSGVLTARTVEGLYDISGTFICSLVNSDSGYLLDGTTYIAAGSTFTLKCGTVRMTVLITSIGAQ